MMPTGRYAVQCVHPKVCADVTGHTPGDACPAWSRGPAGGGR
jgi:hypothetical protein